MPIEIGFRDPYSPLASTAEGEPDRAAISTLDDDERSHVHGTLWIRVNGKDLPALGYFGPDDVCFGSWAAELDGAARALAQSDPSRYVFDEGEQGQPAFVFERNGDTVLISVERSRYDDSADPPEWTPQSCDHAEFQAQVAGLLVALDATVSAASSAGRGWLRVWLKRGG